MTHILARGKKARLAVVRFESNVANGYVHTSRGVRLWGGGGVAEIRRCVFADFTVAGFMPGGVWVCGGMHAEILGGGGGGERGRGVSWVLLCR